ncbi:MAG: flagellar basal body rod protein FlgC [bacterium]|nr:flagellar basal body rod protein FlgC [bacterium]
MSLQDVFKTGASALSANRFWLETIANNMANSSTTRTAEGGPYQRQSPLFQELLDSETGQGHGVEVTGVVRDSSPGELIYKPGHPDADANGFVRMPNVNVVTEMVDMISVQRAYDASVTTVQAAKNMINKSLEIGR